MLRQLVIVLLVFSPNFVTAGEPKVGDKVFLKPSDEATVDGVKVDLKSIPIPASVDETAGEKVRLGRAWVRITDAMTPQEAWDFYSEQIRGGEVDATVWENRGLAAVELSQRCDAIKDFTAVVELDPKNARVLALRNRVRNREIGGRGEDIAEFDEDIKLDPTNAELYLARGDAWFGQTILGDAAFLSDKGHFERAEAIKDYTQAIKLNPQLVNAYLHRAGALTFSMDIDAAINDWSQVIKLDPENTEAYKMREGCYLLKGNVDLAIRDATEVIKLDPMNAESYSSRVQLLELKKDFDGAIRDYTEVIKLKPQSSVAYCDRGRSRQAAGQYQEALSDFKMALSVNPESECACDGLAWLLATSPDDQIRNGKEALEYVTKAIELTDGKADRYVASLAAAYAEVGDFENAVKWQEKELASIESILASLDQHEGIDRLDGLMKSQLEEIRQESKKISARLELYRSKQPYRDVSKR